MQTQYSDLPDGLPASKAPSLVDFWKELLSGDAIISAQQMTSLLIAGGLAALYVRFLYRRFNGSPSGADSVSRTFPLLLIVTTAVIAVVKSSLALSLGLVGALSIVRFRAAIKEPEELVYLFLCIAVGLSLGAEKPVLAAGLLATATALVIVMHFLNRRTVGSRLLLTIRGDARQFHEKDGRVLKTLRSVASGWVLHRLDVENGRAQLRIALPPMKPMATTELISRLSAELPDFELSYVNLNSAV